MTIFQVQKSSTVEGNFVPQFFTLFSHNFITDVPCLPYLPTSPQHPPWTLPTHISHSIQSFASSLCRGFEAVSPPFPSPHRVVRKLGHILSQSYNIIITILPRTRLQAFSIPFLYISVSLLPRTDCASVIHPLCSDLWVWVCFAMCVCITVH